MLFSSFSVPSANLSCIVHFIIFTFIPIHEVGIMHPSSFTEGSVVK